MPYRTEKIAIKCHFIDNRSKLIPCQKEMILYWRNEMKLSYNKIAKMFSVSKRTIQFICDPSKLAANLERRKERGGSKIYYDKDKHNDYMKTHRTRKHKIFKDTL